MPYRLVRSSVLMVFLAVVAVGLDAYQHSLSAADRAAIRKAERELHARLDRADAERNELRRDRDALRRDRDLMQGQIHYLRARLESRKPAKGE